jgi:hypothetical protein
MNFWIVGIDHEWQLLPDSSGADKLRSQKDDLKRILTDGIAPRRIRFIAEESKLGKATIAMYLAESSNPAIPWVNIIMTEEEREKAGIAAALKKPRQGSVVYDGTAEFRMVCRIPEDEKREDFFIEATLRQAGDAKNILMLLGGMHVDAVDKKLRLMGHNVTANLELFPVKRWETCI